MGFDRTEGMAAYAAPSLFQPHRARQAIRDAHEKKIPPLLGYYLGLLSPPVVRLLAPMKFDAVWIDWEHSAGGIETITTLIHDSIFMSEGRTIPFVRVPSHEHTPITYALDAGASIIVPRVETAEEAKKIMAATKYGLKSGGVRSAPPFRLIPGLTDIPYDKSRSIYECLNDQAAVCIQIESVNGIDNLDEILTECPDIDFVWLGQLDCRVSMGLPGGFGVASEPEWLAAKEKFMSIMKKHDKPYGGFAFANPAIGGLAQVAASKENMSFMIVTSDITALTGLAQELKDCREVCVVVGMRESCNSG
ncbi:Pyruvate/Phosphoenolpyruvate kinase-like domain-containing protein [Stachybotrys elegans]|uniref:Pyruvate/Phosphoenolpyruvate kinase-like domain-containing protein n=1 Tax=Stachybotrys elegans TaxID=80388 RepID=A0A8K0WNP8_9HYPO|nr:Pyruvate/Phosphoenolpyruvate kinase-like domain-containing protein [Stachybotrys elegans]